jgi:hypothetical protein
MADIASIAEVRKGLEVAVKQLFILDLTKRPLPDELQTFVPSHGMNCD